MKTHIIQLEHHDDIVSACDKMNWARGGRILLVWPEDRSMLNRRLDLTLLKRRASALGAPLALVSNDRDVRYYAPRLGIPVFRTQRKAQDANWRPPRRFRNPPLAAHPAEAAAAAQPAAAQPAVVEAAGAVSTAAEPGAAQPLTRPRPQKPDPVEAALWAPAQTPRARLTFFALGVLAMLTIAAVLLPSAVVEVAPQTQVQDALIDIQAGPEIKRVDIGGAVPAHWVSVTVEGRDMLPASGTLQIPESAASGEIVFTNLTEQAINVPAGTVVRSQDDPPVRFVVTRGGTVAAGPGETLALPAEALEAGEAGNLPAERLTAIEGLIGSQVSAANPNPMRGGRSRAIPAPTEEDHRKLAEQLTAALEATARQELEARLGDNDVLIAASLERVQTVEESPQPRPGLPADRLALNLRLEFRALAVAGSDLRALAVNVFNANLPRDAVALDETLRIENLEAPQKIDSGYRWQVHAHRQITGRLSEARVVRAVLGRSAGGAAVSLERQLQMDEPARIRVWPAWWPRLPVLPFRIQVKYANPGG